MALVLVFIFILIPSLTTPNVQPDYKNNSALTETIPPILAYEKEQRNRTSVLCVVKIMGKYFQSKRTYGQSTILMDIEVRYPSNYLDAVFNVLSTNAYNMNFIIKSAYKQPNINETITPKISSYFLIVNFTEEAMDAIRLWKSLPSWNPYAQVLVLIYFQYDDQILKANIIREVLENFLQFNMLNVHVVNFIRGGSILNVSTWFPFDNGNCAEKVKEIHLIDICDFSSGNAKLTELIPNKLKLPKKLTNCLIRVTSGVWEPFVYYEEGKGFFNGIDVLLVRALAAKFEMIPKFIRIKESRANRKISNQTGLYAYIIRGSADLLIGGLDRIAAVQNIVGETISYYQEDQTWCVQRAKVRNLWENIFAMFTLDMWFLIVLCTQVVSLAIYVLMKFANRYHKKTEDCSYSKSFLISMTTALSLPTPNFCPVYCPLRTLIIFCLVYGIVLTNTFNSYLISVITKPRTNLQVYSIDSAVHKGFRFAGGTVVYKHYEQNEEVENLIRERFMFCEKTDKCLMQLVHDEKLAVGLSRQHALNHPDISPSRIYCFPWQHNIYAYAVVIQTRPDYYLLPAANELIRRFLEFGLIELWNRQSQTKLAKYKDIAINKNATLTFDHIIGAIIVLIVGLTISILIFCLEQLLFYNLFKKIVLIFVNNMQKLMRNQ